MGLIDIVRRRKAAAISRAHQKANAERQNADLELKLDDWKSGFGPNPFRTDEECSYTASFSLDGDDDERGDW
jgi:hypothetical protein